MSTNAKHSSKTNVLLAGVAGASAVSIQTISLLWANNALKGQTLSGLNLFESAAHMYKTGGLKQLYKGAISSLAYTSFARFGDMATNFLVLDMFKNSQMLYQTPLFLQSSISWALASAWRVIITPISIFTNPENLRQVREMNPRYRVNRAYAKQVRPQIASLYSWFLVQNYLTEYTETAKFSENSLQAFSHYGAIGFLSMISYDIYLKAKTLVWSPKILSGFRLNRVFFRGLHGVIFCTSSHYIKERLEQ